MKISTSLKVGIIILAVFSLISMITVFWQLDKMDEDGNVVNYAGRQRAISQRLAKFVLAKQQGLAVDEQIKEHSNRLERIINGLINGDAELKLPKLTDQVAMDKMKEVSAAWQNYKLAIQSMKNDPTSIDSILKESERFLKLADESTTIFAELSAKKVSTLKTIQTILVLLNITILIIIWFLVKKKVITPLQNLTNDVNKIAKGDLTLKISYGSKGDEIHALSSSMQTMINAFNSMINKILSSAKNVVSSVDVLKERANKTTQGAQNQSSQATQIATAAEEMSQTITDIARNASTASESSEIAMKFADEGKKVSDGAIDSVNSVYNSTIQLASMIEKLNNRASEIGDIVTVIKDIADQTNLLALNAAIEAARAGEQGRGFAVVADEVRKLAERTIKATAEITEKINAVQSESQQTMTSMQGASEEVTKATDFIKKVGDALNEIVDSVQKVRDQIMQIATAVDEQSAASEEVAKNIEKTSNIAKEMERMAEDVMQEVNTLTRVSDELKQSTTGFQTT
ncbi:MAG: methyl-accepting chemotaxis protein [Thermodesulfovibrionales bacterium]|nr:methyl-accepting chemotaxis protein [Thermodesulfovibrionales bacterium]